MGRLEQQVLLQLHSATLTCHLGESRLALLGGIDSRFVASLPTAASPSEQILRDLYALNEISQLADGAFPFVIWLRNAQALAASRREALPFALALEKVTAHSGPTSDANDERPSSLGLELSDVQIIPHLHTRNCTLDFRVWNRGSSDALVNRVLLEVVELADYRVMGHLGFSKEYDLDIGSLQRIGDSIMCNVSQLLRPNEIDRFGVRLTASGLEVGQIRTWRLIPSLLGNTGRVDGPPIAVTLPLLEDSWLSHLVNAGLTVKRTVRDVLRLAAEGAFPHGVLYLPDTQIIRLDTLCFLLGDPRSAGVDGRGAALLRDAYLHFHQIRNGIISMTEVCATVARVEQLGCPATDDHLLESLVYYLKWNDLLPSPGAPGPLIVDAEQRARDRVLYTSFGEERPGTSCRQPDCTRGAVQFSVFCKRHHFESVEERLCPFDD